MLKILDEREQNSFYDPEKANNGGGYHQPRIEFEFEGIRGFINDTSCGDFGDRYIIKWGDCEIYVNTMDREPTFESTFPDTPQVRRLFDALGDIYRKYELFTKNELYLYEEV